MLCFAMLCLARPCYVMLCFTAMLCHAMLCYEASKLRQLHAFPCPSMIVHSKWSVQYVPVTEEGVMYSWRRLAILALVHLDPPPMCRSTLMVSQSTLEVSINTRGVSTSTQATPVVSQSTPEVSQSTQGLSLAHDVRHKAVCAYVHAVMQTASAH